MDYYTLEPAVDTKETGSEYPQVQKMAPGYNYKASNSVHALSRAYQEFPSYTPNLDYFILHNRAKPTDLLSVAVMYGGFLVSPKLKELLEQFNLPPHKFYPAKVAYKKDFYEYYWMHIICNLTDHIDYSHSIFFVYYNYAHDMGNVEVNSKEDFLAKKNKLKEDNPDKNITIWSKKIVFKNSFNKQLDLFDIGSFDSNYYISEKLKSKLEESNISGVNIERTDKIIIP